MNSDVINAVAYAVTFNARSSSGAARLFRNQKKVVVLNSYDEHKEGATRLLNKMLQPTSTVTEILSIRYLGSAVMADPAKAKPNANLYLLKAPNKPIKPTQKR